MITKSKLEASPVTIGEAAKKIFNSSNSLNLASKSTGTVEELIEEFIGKPSNLQLKNNTDNSRVPSKKDSSR